MLRNLRGEALRDICRHISDTYNAYAGLRIVEGKKGVDFFSRERHPRTKEKEYSGIRSADVEIRIGNFVTPAGRQVNNAADVAFLQRVSDAGGLIRPNAYRAQYAGF